MDIYGLQKLTLLDFPGVVACTVFFGGCDFRCPFCHNFELVELTLPPLMQEAELLSFLKKRQGMLEGVCITGGEPLLQPGLPALLEKIRALDYQIKLDTNGSHPKALEKILPLVDYVAMDIKNAPAHYPQTIGRDDFDMTPVFASAKLLMEGNTPYEFRTTVVEELHKAEDFRAIARWIAGAQAYYLQAFTQRDTVPTPGLSTPAREKMEQYLSIVRQTIPNAQIRGME